MTVVIENTINQLVRLHKYVNEDKEYRRLEMNNYCFSINDFSVVCDDEISEKDVSKKIAINSVLQTPCKKPYLNLPLFQNLFLIIWMLTTYVL